MLRGDKVGLRARLDTDVAVLHAELYDDVATQARADSRPWQPVGPGPTSRFAVGDPTDAAVEFSVVSLADEELAGAALLWGIDMHNRAAHIGMSLRPKFRGRGLGSDVVRVLCRYGFDIRGLHRIQAETLVDNAAMVGAAAASGFIPEGTLRDAAWVDGTFVDVVTLGLLAPEWRDR